MPKSKKVLQEASLTGIVAIGASAGGLESFIALLNGTKSDTGFAFVLLQHLDPSHHSQLAEILGRTSPLRVTAVEKKLRPQPNNVYVMAADHHLLWSAGFLVPVARLKEEALNHFAIDRFLSSLAQENELKKVGVILSGLNADGAAGLKALRDSGALTLVLDPKLTEFAVMPTSAIEAGAAEQILPLSEIGEIISSISPARIRELKERSNRGDGYSLSPVLDLLHGAHGVDFNAYKSATLRRRIERRMLGARCATIEDFAAYLKSHPAELRRLFEEVTIHVTGFFRDEKSFAILRSKILPRLWKAKRAGEPLRIWIAGCSTGQEAYSVAIMALEAAEAAGSEAQIQLFATDISEESIKVARKGLYSAAAIKEIPPKLRRKYFIAGDGGYHVVKALRNACVFARQDLTADPAFSRLDLICCRNVLIYFQTVAQERALRAFHSSLVDGGCLFLGSAESTGEAASLFPVIDRHNRFFLKNAAGHAKPLVATGEKSVAPTPAAKKKSQAHGFSMPAMAQAIKLQLDSSHRLLGNAKTAAVPRTEAALARELKNTRQHFRNLLESQSILYEELQATHEEVLASNEELQTKNEELETTQEELRAANEELRTVNDEILDRNEQLDLANARLEKLTVRLTEEEAYASAIVETVREPLLVLDSNLCVYSANHAFYEKFKVKKESTEGEPLFRLGNGQWDIPALKELLENVLPGRDVVTDFEVSHEFPRIGRRTMLLNAREVARESGAEAFILLAIEDISDRVRQRSALLASKDRVESERDVSRTDAAELRLERSLREKFVLALSHDLRNPMAGAKLSAQLLIRRASNDASPDEGTLRTLKRIVENMNRADRMITDLLDANRIKAGQGVSLKREPLDLAENLRTQSAELSSRYGERLVWIQGEGELKGDWDPDAITRILENLIGNAFKYGLDPEPVTVKVEIKNIQVDISVHNEGKPISLQDQQSLFDQFRRAEDTKLGGKDGWGLGLTLVKGLSEAMGGYVSVQSSAAEGTTFTVCLPR